MKNLKTYLLYHLKWQVGIIVSWPCMYLLHDMLGWNNFCSIVGFQFIGALLFWNIDKLIFKYVKTNKDETQDRTY
jgi:hypothetical protein